MRRNKPRELAKMLHGNYLIDQPTITATLIRTIILLSFGALIGCCFIL